METIGNLVTAARLVEQQGDGYRCELILGEVVKMSPTGGKHGVIALRIGRLLGNWADQQGIGLVFAAETGFKLATNPDTVRAADVALVLNERVPAAGVPDSFWEGAPDLAVEVLSPNDSASDVLDKVRDYLAAGADQVWIADPKSSAVSVYRSLQDVQTLTARETLVGTGAVEGFRCGVGEFFAAR